ncbi:yqeH [Symbiodinium sp. CCMP2456]|nr:yqeH [Symbiodinium sp. CCMP2456]
MVFCRSHLSIQMAAVAAQRLSIPRLAGESCRGGFFRTCWPDNHGSVGMVSATRSASSSRAWPSQSDEKSQDVEVKVPAGAVVGDVTKEAGMEELLRASRGGGGGLRIHKRCHGCGAWLHSNDPEEHGYVPEEAREKFSLTGRRKVRATPKGVPVDVLPQGVEVMRDTSVKYKDRTRMLVCQRCYRLQHYHRMDTSVKGGFYRMEGGRDWEHEAEIVEKIVRRMRKGSIVLMVVDLLDFESSLVPELFDACRNRRFPVIVVVNKVDCLLDKMRDKEKGLARLKVWVRRMSRQIRNVHTNDVVLISSSSGHGFKQLEERLRHHLLPEDPKWMYVVGRVNSGKSTFVNRFLWYIGYKHQGAVHYKRAVGGVTRSPVPGTTLHFVSFGLPKGFRLVDCPGIPSRHQVTAQLQEAMDLYAVVPRKRINSISYALHTGRSFLAGALVRIDQVQGNISFLSSFFGLSVTLHVCQTCKVEDLLSRKAGDFFYPPHSRDDFERLGPLVRHRVEVFGSSDRAWDDIVIAGMGWVSISGYGTKVLDVWVPKGVKVFRRPALMPQEMRSRGITRFHVNHRARSPKIFRKKNGMVKARQDKELRDKLRAEQADIEAEQAAMVEVPDDVAFVDSELELPPGYSMAEPLPKTDQAKEDA